jgi:internalin A
MMGYEAERRIQEALRNNATSLDLKGLQLKSLPDSLFELANLRELFISLNQLRVLPESIYVLTQLRALYISNNDLTILPDSITSLRELQILDLSNNHLSALPATMGSLVELRILNASSNQLLQLPETLGGLIKLLELNLADNRLTWLPASINNLTDLKQLILHDNPGLELAPEILGSTESEVALGTGKAANPMAILDYYFASRKSRPLNEAKMILVGRGGAGKTSLVNRLVRNTFDPSESKTEGIAITKWFLRIGEDDMRLNVWDFGGQEIMHATHQFFFTKRSLYLLVINAREGEQDGNIEYWLRLVESFSGNSPVIVVINKIKDHPFDLNRRGLKDKFPLIRNFVQTDCLDSLGIDLLHQSIVSEIDQMPHVRDPFPLSWYSIKEWLSTLKENFISYEQYQHICSDHGLNDDSSQNTLVGFLHDLGIVVNFREHGRLRDTHVLNPHWVTNGIYKVLNDQNFAIRMNGEISLDELSNLLDPNDYPRNKHQYLFDLMEQFEICYEFYDKKGRYLVPELLTKEEPVLDNMSELDSLKFEYRYGILPQGVLPRYIVRSRLLNENLARWKTGLELEFEGNRALVKADIEDRWIKIIVAGNAAGRRRLLSIIRSDFEHIHRSITKLDVKEWLPIPGLKDFSILYEKLIAFEQQGIPEIVEYFNGEVIRRDVGKLLDGISKSPVRQDAHNRLAIPSILPVEVVFSYAREDEKLRDQLETHLKILERQCLLNLWYDRKISPGQNWAGVIDKKITEAQIILLLVSADFISSDYCYQIEMNQALDRHKNGKAEVIPIILRDCEWGKAPFGYLQVLPKDGKPVTEWNNIDAAWKNVVNGVEKVIERLRSQ